MVRTLVKGTNSYHSFNFTGLDKLISNSNDLSTQMLSIDVNSANLQNMLTDLSNLATQVSTMELAINDIYLNPTRNFLTAVSVARTPSILTVTTTLDYLKNWGTYETVESAGTGLWSQTSALFYSGIYKAQEAIDRGYNILKGSPMGSIKFTQHERMQEYQVQMLSCFLFILLMKYQKHT